MAQYADQYGKNKTGETPVRDVAAPDAAPVQFIDDPLLQLAQEMAAEQTQQQKAERRQSTRRASSARFG